LILAVLEIFIFFYQNWAWSSFAYHPSLVVHNPLKSKLDCLQAMNTKGGFFSEFSPKFKYDYEYKCSSLYEWPLLSKTCKQPITLKSRELSKNLTYCHD
jgi:hypothetical protein